MSARPWYKRFPADFVNGCISGHLTAEEVGVYAIVLDMIYDRGPVPNDPRWIGGMVQLSTRRCRSVIDALIKKDKLIVDGDKLTNRRAENDRFQEEKEHRKLSENGLKGAEKTNKKRTHSNKNNTLTKKGPKKSSRHSISHMPDKSSKEDYSESFEKFWSIYPRRIGKGQARKAFIKALTVTDLEKIMEGVRGYVRAKNGEDPKYIAHPATWLNGERWNDEHTTHTQQSKQSGNREVGSFVDAIVRAKARRENFESI